MDDEIVVGVDGRFRTRAAVCWAAREAAARQLPVRLIAVYPGGPPAGLTGAFDRAARALAAAELLTRGEAPGPAVRRTVARGAAGDVLVAASRDAALLVVGGRGRPGSVGHRVAAHATVPVAVVRGRDAGGPVVVGADGSPAGERAVAAAFEFAGLHGCGLIAVRSWVPEAPALDDDGLPLLYEPEERPAVERWALGETIARWRDKFPNVPVEPEVSGRNAADALIALSAAARLVVVGHRTGPAAARTLGSVSLHVLHHARCPVLITHG
ncbi:universal stress protein [Spirilliplanes yamanashiensis]|uniref:UspA domain-containing protein n=1 Tax=Spirilliplanes yamanashiensis TaxID=42233 RepID=A0A8J4DLS3_9ACTN|nr:universal stress protein [Spirilliplanes yamanashiensis]MDP9818284.1 nucleotide-binding universal stress UspA family protein [Spirilliplanes yamanashiensis]GIJ06702.1 hypothetical protein Sya03_60540 [Spirilliplanes yamanashiensis]